MGRTHIRRASVVKASQSCAVSSLIPGMFFLPLLKIPEIHFKFSFKPNLHISSGSSFILQILYHHSQFRVKKLFHILCLKLGRLFLKISWITAPSNLIGSSPATGNTPDWKKNFPGRTQNLSRGSAPRRMLSSLTTRTQKAVWRAVRVIFYISRV